MRALIAVGLLLLAALVRPMAASAAPPGGRQALVEIVAYLRLGADCPRKAPNALQAETMVMMLVMKPPVREEEIAQRQGELRAIRDAVGVKKWCAADYVVEMGLARAAMLALTAK